MNIIDVIGLRWLDPAHTILGGQVITSDIGVIPICLNEAYDTPEGQEIWDDALAGKYVPIFEYVAPPEPAPEERRAMMPDLERWRVNTIIDLEPGLRKKITSAIDAMPEPQRTISKNKLADVQMFLRMDHLFELIGSDPTIGKSPDDIDAMWLAGLALA